MPDEAPRWNDIYGSQYVSPDDLQPGQAVRGVIAEATVREVWCSGTTGFKVTLRLRDARKQIVLNKTSAKTLAAAFISDTSGTAEEVAGQLVGKRVVVKRGRVNGKPAVLVTPDEEATANG